MQRSGRKELLPPAAIASPPSSSPQPAPSAKSKHRPTDEAAQQFHRNSLGDWSFVKTIGAGSMGKVKLAEHNTTHELCAVKIIIMASKVYQRNHANDAPPKSREEAKAREDEYQKELERDRRTIREAALGRLLFHPYICRLYEMVPMTSHYYMLFEHVEGSQMLDYIVSHGLLKERAARKFARGICSALEYCHRNNVVHRDLKIENIMINQKGDVKLIDFGLSNLYAPRKLLDTYCGSLYFAAPELLCATPYVGPEVDVWSFGVVLYVLVCGKVPFDDALIKNLHEKIKQGVVEYPAFLSKECVSLLLRMLVVSPRDRATLFEVSNHPWMNKGYEYRASSYVPKRIPLSLPLNPDIVKTIALFDFGTVSDISEQLTQILSSTEYQHAVDNWYRVTELGREYASDKSSATIPDPTGGFHPLLSLYHLVDEMRKRKKAKADAIRQRQAQQKQEKERQEHAEEEKNLLKQGARKLAGSPVPAEKTRPQEIAHAMSTPEATPAIAEAVAFTQSSDARITGPDTRAASGTQAPVVATPPANTQAATPVAAPKASTPAVPTKVPSNEDLPLLTIPQQAHTSSKNYVPTSGPTPSEALPEQQPTSPRETSPTMETLDPGKLSGFNNLFRRLSGKKKNSSPVRSNLSPRRSPAGSPSPIAGTPPTIPKVVLPPSPTKSQTSLKDPMVRRGVSMKVTAREKSSSSRVNLAEETKPQREAKLSVDKRSHKRSASTKVPGFVPVEYLPPLPSFNADNQVQRHASVDPQRTSGENHLKVESAAAQKASGRKMHPTARAKSVGGHVRKNSYHKSEKVPRALPNAMGSQNSDELIAQELGSIPYIPQLTEDEILEQYKHAKPNSMPSIEHCKTWFLKGFFSVQTTLGKPLPVIRYNIINVLTRLGVAFVEVKGGFVCSHAPSLQAEQSQLTLKGDVLSEYDHGKHTSDEEERKLYGDAFKLTSSLIDNEVFRTGTPDSGEKTPSRQPSLLLNTQMLSPKTHRLSNLIGSHRRKFLIRKRNGSGSVSMPPNTPATAKVLQSYDDDEEDHEEGGDEYDSVDSLSGLGVGGGSDMLISSKIKLRARHQHLGSISDEVRGGRLPLKFEIYIVKVPFIGLYGVQFKKLLGNTWNYKTLAGQILTEMNL